MLAVYVDSEPAGPQGGGIRTYIRQAVHHAQAMGFRPMVFSHTPAAYRDCPVEAIGRRPLPYPLLRPLMYRYFYRQNVFAEHSLWLAKKLSALSFGAGFAEFCDFNGYALFSLLSSKLKKRCIVRIHTPQFLVDSEDPELRPLERTAQKLWETQSLSRAGCVTAPSAAFVRERLGWLRRFWYLPNPAPSQNLTNPGSPGWSGRRKSFLFVGRMEPRKGVDVLVTAFGRLLHRHPDCTLSLAGAWPASEYSAGLRRQLGSLPRDLRQKIDVLGELDAGTLERQSAGHRYGVMPSRWENSPYSFFEAIGRGLVCLGTRTGEMGVVMRRTGGGVIAPGDANSLCAAMCRLVESDSFARALQGRQAKDLERRRITYRREFKRVLDSCRIGVP